MRTSFGWMARLRAELGFETPSAKADPVKDPFQFAPTFETLEIRDVMAASLMATLTNGTLRVEGTEKTDKILVAQNNGQIAIANIQITKNGQQVASVAANTVQAIQVYGLGGNDVIDLQAGTQALAATLYVEGGAGADWIRASAGNATIHGGLGNDKIYGGSGNDYLYGNEGADIIDDSLDTRANGVNYLYGGLGNDKLYGSQGTDFIYGGLGADAIFGNAGNDYLYDNGGSGDGSDGAADKIYGGAGNDTINAYYDATGKNQLFGDAGNDVIYGGQAADKIYGGAGNDSLYGYGGDDLLSGGGGLDSFSGGSGFNRFGQVYDPTQWVVDGTSKTDINQAEAGTCAILSALAATCDVYDLAARITYLGFSKYQVQLYNNGVLKYVNVKFDGTWNDNDPHPYDSSTGAVEYWHLLFQRAYLQMFGVNWNKPSPESAKNVAQWANLQRALSVLNGQPLSQINMVGVNYGNAFDLIQSNLELNVPVVTGTKMNPQTFAAHAYAVLDLFQNNGAWMIKLYNPWGFDATDRQNVGLFPTADGNSDGIITISWADYVNHFSYFCFA